MTASRSFLVARSADRWSAAACRLPFIALAHVVVFAGSSLSGCAMPGGERPRTMASCPMPDARVHADWFARAQARQVESLGGCAIAPDTPSAATPRLRDTDPVPPVRIDPVPMRGDATPPAAPWTAGTPAPEPAVPVPPSSQAASPSTPHALLSTPMRRLAGRVDEVARRNAVDPLLLHAVIHVESRHRSEAVSPAGARGAMQLMPGTAERFGVQQVSHLHDDGFNLAAGAALLKSLQAEFGDDLDLVLAAYNAGEGAVRRHGRRVPPYPETQAYVRDVRATYRDLTARRTALQAGVPAALETLR